MPLIEKSHRVSVPVEQIVFLLLGVTILLMSLPTLASNILRFSANSTIDKIVDGRQIKSIDQLHKSRDALQSARAYTPNDRTVHNNLASISLRLFEETAKRGDTAKSLSWLADANQHVTEAIKRAPANTNLWYLAAETDVRLNGVSDRARKTLQMSYLTGLREYWVLTRRLKFALSIWPHVGEEMQEMARKELRLLREPDRVTIFQASPATGRDIVIEEFADEKDRERFLRTLKRRKII